MKKITCSVILPTRNRASSLLRTLNGLLKQRTSFNWELIIIDDGSTDNTWNLVQSFDFKHIHVKKIRNSVNKGVAASRNTGIKESKGSFIAFIDDDVVPARESWLQELVDFIKKQPPRVAAAGGSVYPPSEASSFMRAIYFLPKMSEYTLEREYKGLFEMEVDHVSTTNSIWRKDIFSRHLMFDESLKRGSDIEFCYRVAKHGYVFKTFDGAPVFHYYRSNLRSFIFQQYISGRAVAEEILRHGFKRFSLFKTFGMFFMILTLPLFPVYALLFFLHRLKYLLKKREHSAVFIMFFVVNLIKAIFQPLGFLTTFLKSCFKF